MSTSVSPDQQRPLWKDLLHPAVIVGALGYFVDIYDLTLFMTVREQSLKDLGLGHLITGGQWYHDLMSWQMAGMLLGGIFFGILGDRMGRLTTLFGSILLYSLANIANGFVNSFEAYATWRFIAGIGLAGELGGCIALVSESLSKERRGYGTALVATVGVFGAVVAGLMAEVVTWRTNFFIGGGLGLALLAMRVGVRESGMFNHAKVSESPGAISRGNFFALFTSRDRFARYARCILIGLPTWFMIGILVQRAGSHFAPAMGVEGAILSSRAVALFYLGLTFGDFGSGFGLPGLQRRLRGRLSDGHPGLDGDQFLRAHLPAWPWYGLLGDLRHDCRRAVWHEPPRHRGDHRTQFRARLTGLADLGLHVADGDQGSALAQRPTGICFGAAFLALWKMEETYGKDLDYQEKQ
ncbi:MAG: hypothetical protein RJB43_1060 [Verrucomicrobiota bacterium]